MAKNNAKDDFSMKSESVSLEIDQAAEAIMEPAAAAIAPAADADADAAPVETAAAPVPTLAEQAESIVQKYVLWAMAGGVAPVLIDSILVSGVQIKMLRELSKLYDVAFSQNLGKTALATLIGGLGSGTLSRSMLASAAKMIPFVGPVFGFTAMPVLAGAATFALGKLFSQHFASGGTFLTFDASGVKDTFADYYEQGKKASTNVMRTVKEKVKFDGSNDAVAEKTAAVN